MENKSVTDKIYQELVDGLKTGLDWTHFLARHSASKGPLYNAIGRFFKDMEEKVTALNEVQGKLNQAGLRVDQAGLRVDQLNQEINEADKTMQAKNQDIVVLGDKEDVLKKQIEVLKSDFEQKSELLQRLEELEKLGFGAARLDALHTVLLEVGTKRGLKINEAVDTFFADLKDYDAMQGFTQELQRLDVIIRTKSLQAEKWGTEAESLERRYKDLQAAIAAVQSLSKQGVKPEQIISWNKSMTSVGGVEQFEKALNDYESVQELLATKQREAKRLEINVAKLNGEVNTLEEQKAELEGSIRALRVSALEEIEKFSQISVEKINRVAQAGTNSIGEVGEIASAKLGEALSLADEVSARALEVIGEVGEIASGKLGEALSLVDELSARALEVGKTIGQVEAKLNKSKGIIGETSKLVTTIEAER